MVVGSVVEIIEIHQRLNKKSSNILRIYPEKIEYIYVNRKKNQYIGDTGIGDEFWEKLSQFVGTSWQLFQTIMPV